MKISMISVWFLFFGLVVHGQEQYLGRYTGELKIFNANGIHSIPMEFHFLETNDPERFDYVLIYNNEPRNYTLIVQDKENGRYVLDENNGIVLPTTYKDGVFYSLFEVQGSLLTSRIAFQADAADFEIIFSNTTDKTITGGEEKDIPQVTGYPISVVQKARLTRIQ